MIEGDVLQQLGGLWRWLQEQSPAVRVLILAVPVVVAALLVLGGLMIWSVTRPLVAQPMPTPTVVPQPASTSAAAPGQTMVAIVIATATPLATPLPPAPTQPVLVPGRDPAGSPTPVTSPTPTSSPSPTATPTPEPARSARIVETEGQGANMRRAPSVSAQRVKVIPEGTVVELVGGEQRGDGYTWRNVRDVDGSTGFVIVDYLQPIEGAPGAPPVLPPPPIRVEEITSPAPRGGEATLTIVTRPGVRCELRVLIFGPAEMPKEGLENKMADADGVCSWTWKVPEEALPGAWRYRISAGEGEGRATREVPIVIS
jgi:SH3-like domain-containing protein